MDLLINNVVMLIMLTKAWPHLSLYWSCIWWEKL